MKSILISIKPEWVVKILNGDKTIEIRKTMPKRELPIKCYIYCTKRGTPVHPDINGKVVAEFTLNKVEELEKTILPTIPTCVYLTKTKRFASAVEKIGCLSQNEIYNYLGGKNGYAWYIDNLKIYDNPKELEEYKHFKRYDWWDYGYHTNKPQYELEGLTKPPQSWRYVEVDNA